MNRDHLITILKGMWIGGTMTVPGVSGGSMAMIMGVYDRLISSVSSFFRNPGKSMSFLVRFVLGGRDRDGGIFPVHQFSFYHQGGCASSVLLSGSCGWGSAHDI